MLDAAVAVFSHRGFRLASIDEIAEAAGVSKPMIYAYPGAKELFTVCIRREMRRLMELATAAVPSGLATDERLHVGLLAFFAFVTEHRDGWIVLYRQARVRKPFAGEIAAARERIIAMVAGLLADSSGDQARTSPVGHALVGAADALLDWALDHPEETPNALTARLMDIFWTGLKRSCGESVLLRADAANPLEGGTEREGAAPSSHSSSGRGWGVGGRGAVGHRTSPDLPWCTGRWRAAWFADPDPALLARNQALVLHHLGPDALTRRLTETLARAGTPRSSARWGLRSCRCWTNYCHRDREQRAVQRLGWEITHWRVRLFRARCRDAHRHP